MTTTLYGIPNCNQVKNARDWLTDHHIPYVFHDFKKQGVTRALIQTWLDDVSLETLLNRQGTTWRSLSDDMKNSVNDTESSILLMLSSPTVIKRPVLHHQGHTMVGFSDERYQTIFHAHS